MVLTPGVRARGLLRAPRGKQPRPPAKAPKAVLWQAMCPLPRQPGCWLRSSHAFKECVTAHWSSGGADNARGSSTAPKRRNHAMRGKGAFHAGEGEARAPLDGMGSEDAGMSSERAARNRSAETQGFLGELIPQGQPGAKARPQGAADARRQNIPVPGAGALRPMGRRGRIREHGVLDVPVKARREGPREIRSRISRDARRATRRSRGFQAS